MAPIASTVLPIEGLRLGHVVPGKGDWDDEKPPLRGKGGSKGGGKDKGKDKGWGKGKDKGWKGW